MDPADDHDQGQGHHQQSQQQASSTNKSGSANPPQVRSRITVVCAECKRLKLKCDRRTPCGSCVKRDTVVRCIYSPAAAEKVDLHSLNNRLIHVEQWIQQFGAEGPPPLSTNAPTQAQGQPAASTSASTSQGQAPPAGPPPPTTALSVPLHTLHTACLAPLGIPQPSFPSSSAPHPKSAASSPAHAALARVGAAPFPYAWFEARAYGFLSALKASDSHSHLNGTSSKSTPTPDSTAAAKALAKAERRREKERNRERARAIFAGGAAAYAANGLPPLPQSLSSTLTLGSPFNTSAFAASSSQNYNNASSSQNMYNAGSNSYNDPYNSNNNVEFPPIHALAVSEDADADPDADLSADVSVDASDDGVHADGGDGEGDGEVDELDDGEEGGVRLRQPHPHPKSGIHDSGLAQRERSRRRGDARMAFFALLCAVLSLSPPSTTSSAASDEGVLEEEHDLARVAEKAAEEYFSGANAVSSESGEAEQEQADTDAVLAMWALGVGMMRKGGKGGEEAYVHFAKTIAHARVVGLDLPSSHTLSLSLSATSSSQQLSSQAQSKKRQRPHIKTEDGVEGMFLPSMGVDSRQGGEGRWARAMRARTWWAVVCGDLLAADALGVPPHVAFGSLPPSLTSPSSQDGEDADPLARGADWTEEGETNSEEAAQGGGREAVWGVGAIRAHSPRGARPPRARRRMSRRRGDSGVGGSRNDNLRPFPRGNAGYGGHGYATNGARARKGSGERWNAEVALLANRAVLRVWVGWLTWTPSSSSSSSAPPQAVFGAVDAAHKIVLACRAASASSDSKASLALLVSPPARALFDASVVCAWAALRHPAAVFAPGAKEGLGAALGVFASSGANANANDLFAAWTGRAEAVRVLEGLARRAGVANANAFGGAGVEIQNMNGPPGVVKINGLNVNVNVNGHHLNGHAQHAHLTPQQEHPPTPTGSLKRKHDAIGGGAVQVHPQNPHGHGHGQQQQHAHVQLNGHHQHQQVHQQHQHQHQQEIALEQAKPDKLSLALALKEKEREREREREMGKDREREREKKKRAGYPSVGIRVRPGSGKEGMASPVSPLRKSSLPSGNGKNAPSPLARTQDEAQMGYYPQQAQQAAQQQQQQHQHAQQQQVSSMDAYRSRSSSISQSDPRMQPPKEQHQVVAMEFTMPFSSGASSSVAAAAPGESGRWRVGLCAAQALQQQQGYAGDSASAAMYDLQPQRAGSYEDAYGSGAGSVGSPYGTGNSSASGPLSTASSPYTTTSASGGLSTPTFGGSGSGSTSGAQQNPSPPGYAPSPRFASQQPAYYAATYDAQGPFEHPLGMDGGMGYEGHGGGKAQLYEVKPLMEHHNPYQQQQQHHHLEQEPRHDMAWAPPDPPQAQYSQFGRY
ncbi:Fungal specific transcription [Mycena venus]|uniref:Fungal specific transcription n=1 Tax=Mycena venus TaxID=2733690 RepID=A0A8H7CNT0_9AGAR|nr:Fungal specific transcription [Mycena venus]